MPTSTAWVAPELFFTTHAGVNVFYTYEDDDMDRGRNRYHFTLYSNTDMHPFDVRDLDLACLLDQHPPYLQGENNTSENREAWKRWHEVEEPDHIRAIIEASIDAGLIPLPEDMVDNAHEVQS
jgi:hypothetical protein